MQSEVTIHAKAKLKWEPNKVTETNKEIKMQTKKKKKKTKENLKRRKNNINRPYG